MTNTDLRIKKRSKAHQRYRLADGTIVPGVSTVLGIINKPALVKWANNLGLQGIDSSNYADETARIGTLAHEMVQEYLNGPTWDRAAYTADQVDMAENAVLSFYEWERCLGEKLDTMMIERQFVSEQYRFGGTVDWFGRINGKWWLVDFKTGKGVHEEAKYQVAAYTHLLEENGFPVEGVRILRIGRSEDEGFDDVIIDKPELEEALQVFLAAKSLYDMTAKFKRRCK